MHSNFTILCLLLLTNMVLVNADMMKDLGEIAFLIYLAIVLTVVLAVVIFIRCIMCLCACLRPSNINNTNIIVDRRKQYTFLASLT